MKKEKLELNNKSSMIITNLVRIILIVIFILGFVFKDYSQTFLVVLTFFMTYYPSILEKRFGVYLPSRLEIIITLFIYAAQVLGEMNGFYDKIPWWDTMLHATSGIILGIVGFLFVYLLNEKGNTNVNLSPIFVVIVAFCVALTLGVFWEIFEYSADRLLGYNMQKFRLPGQDGLVDTMQDLIVDSIGALVACAFGWMYIKNKKDPLFNNYFDKWFKLDKTQIKNKKDKKKDNKKEEIKKL